MRFSFESSLPVPVAAQDVYAWHQQPGAFERLLPPWGSLRRIHGEGIHPGSEVTLRLPGGLHWRLRLDPLDEGLGFEDNQVRGPFKEWVHEHRFEETGPQSCQLKDHVEAQLPWGAGFLANRLTSRLHALLAYRSRVIAADFACRAQLAGPLPQRRILMTGANGLIGRALRSFLMTQGCTIVPLVLRKGKEAQAEAFLQAQGPFEAVIHLCGESIFQRWNDEAQARIRHSRVDLTHWLCKILCRQEPFVPKVLISASGVGFYGYKSEAMNTESSPRGTSGFLSQLSHDWEAATQPLQMAGSRVVWLRLGAVMSPAGGFLQKMLPPFRMGLGAILHSGLHRLSWIAIDDLLYLVAHILTDRHYEGPLNAVAPQVINHENLARTLGAHLGKPPRMHLSKSVLNVFKGAGLTEEILLADLPCAPQKVLDLGFHFTYPDFKHALSHLLPH